MLLGSIASLCMIAVVFFLGNRWNKPPFGPLRVGDNDGKVIAGDRISVTTWNIGFGALGANADLSECAVKPRRSGRGYKAQPR